MSCSPPDEVTKQLIKNMVEDYGVKAVLRVVALACREESYLAREYRKHGSARPWLQTAREIEACARAAQV